jgi:hypothetical protein
MRYRSTRIPGAGPPTPPELVLYTHPEAEVRVRGDGSVADGQDASALDRELRDAGMLLRPVFGGRDRLRRWAGQRRAGAPCAAPNLSTYYRMVPVAGAAFPDDPASLNQVLRGIDAVDAAYLRPPAILTVTPCTAPALLPVGGTAGATGDFSHLQGYLDPASDGGIDARYAWTLEGGLGNGVRVADLERGWCMTHEDLDLAADDFMGGVPSSDLEARNHGTAVMGILAGTHDERGVLGICPSADVKAMAVTGDFNWTMATAIRAAAELLSPGDIILVEQMAPGPNAFQNEEDEQWGFIPVEWWPADCAAIEYASSLGIIVVEAAGNGSQDLDDPVYDTAPRAFGDEWSNPLRAGGRDSGAILVGAGAPPPGTHDASWGPDGSRLHWSNWGSRVDVQAWGREVTTTGGYGSGPDELRPVWDENGWYTNRFSGTSSAAPMVAGALACVQGMRLAAGRDPLTPLEARDLLRETGSPQQPDDEGDDSRRIGTRPDLRSMVERAFDGAPRPRGVKPPRRRDDMAKITITIESDGDVNVVGGKQVTTPTSSSGPDIITLARQFLKAADARLADAQRKGPSAPGG